MVNKKHNGKLDEIIKQALSNYEADSNNNDDWAEMEKLLEAAPKSISFSNKFDFSSFVESIKTFSKSKRIKWVFSPYFLIVLLLLCGSYFLINILNSTKSSDDSTDSTPQISTDTLQIQTQPSLPLNELNTESKTELIKDSTENQPLETDKTPLKTEITDPIKEKTNQKETNLIEKSENKKIEKVIIDTSANLEKKEETISPPPIVNTADSSKTVIEGTKEKNQGKKKGKDKLVIPLGRKNFLLHKNSDSLNKNENLPPTDSTKGPN
jgi:hypothetical protein